MVLEASCLGHSEDVITSGANNGSSLPQSATQPEFGEAFGLGLVTHSRFASVG